MRIAFAVVTALLVSSAGAATIAVAPGQSIQAAIDAAADGDTIALAAGTFDGDLDFQGKAVVVRGVGPETILRGTGSGSVVRFTHGEGPGSVLDAVTVTNGLAEQGGAVFALDASPTIVRTTLVGNRAVSAGSAIYLEGSSARIYNNVIARNATEGDADTHGVHLVNASPTIANNTIALGDSNGIFVSGPLARPVIVSNILAYNGSRPAGKGKRGRGICDLGPATVIQWNLFFRNRRAALLTSGNVDYKRVRRAERALDTPLLANNLDASPRFVARRRLDFALRARSRALHGGNPDPAFADRDGTRNTIGHLGGPWAAPATAPP